MLKHLFSPIKIKTMELANRVVMPPMGTQLGNPDATVGDALLGNQSCFLRSVGDSAALAVAAGP